MKNKLLAVLLIALLMFSVVVYAAEDITKIEAYLVSDFKFSVDGSSWSPKDVDGSPLTPIIYKERTYVPVRSLLEDKGVTVGFDGNTRTVILDYSTFKHIDKSTPLLMQAVPETGGGGAGKVSFRMNPDFESIKIPMEQEYSFDLAQDAMIMVDGVEVSGSMDELMKIAETWTMKSIDMDIDVASGAVKSASILSIGDSDEDQALARKIGIEIEISGPPFKIKITIKF
jgi:hypothetical protein